ncbi:MAG: NapC/NirT family cytochrome c [Nitrospiraceae bacterium]|nr:MAG: NapC/NirT family cytochrome c [Nitrospiraceae bacterium]
MALKKKVLILILLAGISIAIVIGLIFGMEAYTSTAKFCGTTCHIMQKPYKSWKKDIKHFEEEVACIECHYAPGEKRTLKAQFRSMGQLFSYLAEPEVDEVRKRAAVSDKSCTVSDCHPPEKYLDKKIRYTNLSKDSKFMKGFDEAENKENPKEYESLDEIMADKGIPFIHKTHEEKTVEGQKMHCNTCHQHVAAENHFEVPKEACYLCHFKHEKYNEGRGKCSLCHEIPTKRLRKEKGPEPEDPKKKKKPITHQSMEKKNVPCQGCHFVIQGGGDLKLEACYDCHDADEELEITKKEHGEITKEDKKKMHETHIAEQHANCFQCHEPMEHREVPEFNTAIAEDCSLCHGETHTYQRMLLAGDVLKGEPKVPALMDPVKTNCMGCHIKIKHDRVKGQKVAKATHESCVGCHTKRHEAMLKEWNDKIKEELAVAKEVRQEAVTALRKAKGKASKKQLAKAEAMFNKAQKYFNIVQHGNGVHNKKYAIILLDAALNNYEDMIDYLAEGG